MSPDPAEPKSFVDADELLPTSVHSFGDENARPDDALSLEDLRGKCDALVKRNTRLEGDLKAAMKELGAARMRKKAEGVPMDLRSTKHLEEGTSPHGYTDEIPTPEDTAVEMINN